MRRRGPINLIWLIRLLQQCNALSLANFQTISLGSVPLTCLVEYDTSIDVCTLSDFDNGCSASCQAALPAKAASLNNKCSGASIVGTSLLGIILNGGIIGALCPSLKTTSKSTSTTSTTPTSTTTIQTTPASVTIPTTASSSVVIPTTSSAIITIPTTSPGITFSPSSVITGSTTSFTIISSTPISSSPSTLSNSVPSTSSPSPSSSISQSTALTSSPTQVSTTATETSTTVKPTNSLSNNGNANGVSGGGSPFDIDANGAADKLEMRSAIGLLVGIWTGILAWG